MARSTQCHAARAGAASCLTRYTPGVTSPAPARDMQRACQLCASLTSKITMQTWCGNSRATCRRGSERRLPGKPQIGQPIEHEHEHSKLSSLGYSRETACASSTSAQRTTGILIRSCEMDFAELSTTQLSRSGQTCRRRRSVGRSRSDTSVKIQA
jgi:hypothetical protein